MMKQTRVITLTDVDIDYILYALKRISGEDDLYRAKMQYQRTPTKTLAAYIEKTATMQTFQQQLILKITAGDKEQS
jgi:hypothetical protein